MIHKHVGVKPVLRSTVITSHFKDKDSWLRGLSYRDVCQTDERKMRSTKCWAGTLDRQMGGSIKLLRFQLWMLLPNTALHRCYDGQRHPPQQHNTPGYIMKCKWGAQEVGPRQKVWHRAQERNRSWDLAISSLTPSLSFSLTSTLSV